MKRQKTHNYYSGLTSILLATFLLCLLAGCAKSAPEGTTTPANPITTSVESYDMDPQSHEDYVRNATNIVTARYIETVQAFRGDEYVYEVREELKGSAGDEPLHVITVGYVSLPAAMPVSGEDVILFLSEYDSVYQDHEFYILLDMAKDTEEERKLVGDLTDGSEPPVEKDRFTRSQDMADILEVTESIFVVSPKEVFVVGTQVPTTTYKCSALSAVRGQPEFSEILIPFFNDSVTIGERYVVLLAKHRENSKIYTLSSPYSVMTEEEARRIPELVPLLGTSQTVDAPNPPTDEETYAAEQANRD